MIAGLTGGIGSGKTTVARLFAQMGAALFYSDAAAKEAYLSPHIREQVISLLGEQAYKGAQIDGQYISSKAFTSPQILKALNAIIHPEVGRLFRVFAAENHTKVVIKESALLFEAGVTAGLDRIIVVSSPDELRISRVMKRDGLSREEVLRKMASQLPQQEKADLADHVIINDEKKLVIPQVEAIFELLKNKSR
jgi:dephospho-CoA kinase